MFLDTKSPATIIGVMSTISSWTFCVQKLHSVLCALPKAELCFQTRKVQLLLQGSCLLLVAGLFVSRNFIPCSVLCQRQIDVSRHEKSSYYHRGNIYYQQLDFLCLETSVCVLCSTKGRMMYNNKYPHNTFTLSGLWWKLILLGGGQRFMNSQ